VAIYAGTGKSGLFRNGEFASVERDNIKKAVKKHEIRLVVATDAACEGLNLQTLGTLINVDLPWNPSRLEQRLGRIKRIGQVRRGVDMLILFAEKARCAVSVPCAPIRYAPNRAFSLPLQSASVRAW
jgi:hypothetical protein